MSDFLKEAIDSILTRVATGSSAVAGVVAMATDAKGSLYEGAAGKRQIGKDADMTLDTVVAIFSCTKAVTGVAALQCVEEGLLDLDAPARVYVPALEEIKVLEGFDAAGQPKLRAPRRDITTRMLLLHTAGFGYEFFNQRLSDFAAKTGLPSVTTCTNQSLRAPLLFDPGDDWEYGLSMDWAGKVVEALRGKRLGGVFRERIFEPLGMADTGFFIERHMRPRLATIHQRGEKGSLVPLEGFEMPQEPEFEMGGGGLYSTAPDYCRFIRMILNDGAGENGRVLKPETVAMAARNGLAGRHIRMLPGVNPALSNDAEFFPGLKKSWGLSFMINDEDAPTGRPAGSLAWAGLANLYFWIDRQNGIGGFWATQLFPFADPVSLGGFLDFETAVYRHATNRLAA